MLEKTDENALALTIIGEARGEGSQGMQAVGNSIMNRVAKKSWYGLTPCEVCFKPWQYSCWNAEDPNRAYLENITADNGLFATALGIAQGVIAGTLPDLTHGATHYYATSMKTPPRWALGLTPCASIGRQLFFNTVP